MKFSINATEFRAALKAACEVAPSKGILPEYSCVFLQADGDELTICAQDANIDIKLVVPCEVQEEGVALAPSRMLLDYVSLASGLVTISMDSSLRMTIKSGKKSSTIACMDASRFRKMSYAGDPILTMSGSDLATSISRTSFCTGTDETRQAICGVRFSAKSNGDIVFAAIDGFKFSRCKISGAKVMDDSDAPKDFTIPNSVLKLIMSLFGNEDAVTVSACEHRASINNGRKMLAFPLYVSKFPPYESLIKPSYRTEMRFDARLLLDALRLVEVAASAAPSKDGRWNICRLKVDGENGCIVLSSDTETSSAESSVDCDVYGVDMEVAFNVRYLIDLASACAKESGTIGLSLYSDEDCACMKPLDCSAVMDTYIAPVRTRN